MDAGWRPVTYTMGTNSYIFSLAHVDLNNEDLLEGPGEVAGLYSTDMKRLTGF